MANDVKRKRIFYLDELRALAILLVILCHTARIYEPFTYENLHAAIPGLLNIIGLVGVPLFFMISGSLLLNRDYTLNEFFKKRFSRILYPSIFWISLTSIIGFLFLGMDMYHVKCLVLGHKYYTWFIWTMIAIYLCLPIINSYIKEYGMKAVEYFLVLWFVTIILSTFNLYPFYSFNLPYFSGHIGYVVLGYYLFNKDFKCSKRILVIVSFILFVLFTLLNMYVTYNSLDIFAGYLSIFVVIASSGFFLTFKYLSYFGSIIGNIHEKIENGLLGKLIFSISICSFGMYFANSLITKCIRLYDIHSMKWIPLLYVFIVISSWILILVLDKIPILKKFVGVS